MCISSDFFLLMIIYLIIIFLLESSLLTLSYEDLEFTLGGYSEKTRWSFLLDCSTTYTTLQRLYYKNSQSYVLSRMFYSYLILLCDMLYISFLAIYS